MLRQPRSSVFNGVPFTFRALALQLYALKDQFVDAHSAGAVNGTLATDGANTRAVVDSDSKLSIANDKLTLAGIHGASDPRIAYQAQTRSAGKVAAAKLYSGDANGGAIFGWSAGASGSSNTHSFQHQAGGNFRIIPNFIVLGSVLIGGCTLWVAARLRTTGVEFYMLGGIYGKWTLLYVDRAGTTTPIYPYWAPQSYDLNLNASDITIPANAIPNPATASDSFNRADGAPGNTDSADGGTAHAWTDALGTSAISSNALGFSALTGGVGISTIDAGAADVLVLANLTRSAGEVGVIVYFADVSNYVKVFYDGTNVKMVRRIGGTDQSANISTAASYSAGATLQVTTNRGLVRVFYNNALIGSEQIVTDAALLSATRTGIYSSDTGNRVDDYLVMPRGVNGEHSALNACVPTQTSTYLACVGDSLTLGGQSGATPYPYQLMDLLGRGSYDYYNYGLTGKKISEMLSDVYWVDTLPSVTHRPICLIWGGTNDVLGGDSATTVYNHIVSFCSGRRAAGYRVLVLTMLPRSGFNSGQETIRTTINSSLVSNWASFAEGLVDVAADSHLTNFNNTTYFNADKTHLTTTGYGIAAGLAQSAVGALP